MRCALLSMLIWLGGCDTPHAVHDAGSTAALDAARSADAASSAADALVAPACGTAPAGGYTTEHALVHDGLDRGYVVHTPRGYDAARPHPIVIAFNGRDGSPEGLEEQTRLSETSDAHGFILVYPRGSGGGSWNAGSCCGSAQDDDVDDVGFVAEMLDALEETYCVDADRVFATGLSNGGFMANRVGCELAHRFAAIAPVAGYLLLDACSATRPVSVVHFHGTADYIVPYDGNRFLDFPSVDESIAIWRATDGCTGEPVETYRNGDSACRTWRSCEDGAEVELCTITLGGHTWPGGYVRAAGGYTTQDLDANEHMWAFFERHAR